MTAHNEFGSGLGQVRAGAIRTVSDRRELPVGGGHGADASVAPAGVPGTAMTHGASAEAPQRAGCSA